MVGRYAATLSTVYSRLASVTKLEELDISANKSRSGVPTAVYQLYNLRRLDMQGCDLTEIGDEYVVCDEKSFRWERKLNAHSAE